jgi:hypothetical protein
MQLNHNDKDLQVLLDLYNEAIDTLKSKLLCGERWENLENQRRHVTELAIAIHKSYNYIVPENRSPINPAEFPNHRPDQGAD